MPKRKEQSTRAELKAQKIGAVGKWKSSVRKGGLVYITKKDVKLYERTHGKELCQKRNGQNIPCRSNQKKKYRLNSKKRGGGRY